jgi:hypothetical protein
MRRLTFLLLGLLLTSVTLVACQEAKLGKDAAAYVVALRSVLVDVRGNPPAGPLMIDSATLAVVDSGTIHALARAGVIPGDCAYAAGAGFGCGMFQRGLVLGFGRLQRLADGRVALDAVVQGRAAPGDHTVIVGTPYRAHIEMKWGQGAWRIVHKDRSGGPGVRAT